MFGSKAFLLFHCSWRFKAFLFCVKTKLEFSWKACQFFNNKQPRETFKLFNSFLEKDRLRNQKAKRLNNSINLLFLKVFKCFVCNRHEYLNLNSRFWWIIEEKHQTRSLETLSSFIKYSKLPWWNRKDFNKNLLAKKAAKQQKLVTA